MTQHFVFGYIGEEDLNIGNDTFSVTLPDGTVVPDYHKIGSQTLLNGVFNALQNGCAGNGSTDDRPALNTLANSTISGGGVIFFPSTYTFRISSNITFPANVTLLFAPDAKLSIDSGKIVTINGPIRADLRTIFSGSGTVVIADSSTAAVYPHWWGAMGDGSNDDTVAIQAAVAATAGRTLNFPAGDYKVTNTIAISPGCRIIGETYLDNGARIIVSGSFNKPVLTTNTHCRIEAMVIIGNAALTDTLQSLIKITTQNEVQLVNLFLYGGYDLVYIDGECFVIELEDIRFVEAKHSWLYSVGNTAPGVDLRMTHCRGTATDTDMAYGLYFEKLGSIVAADCIFSPCHSSGAILHVESLASLAGTQQFSNCVFEQSGSGAPSIRLKGTALLPCKFFQFSNCSILGLGVSGISQSALQIDYGFSLKFSNCYLSASGVTVRYVNSALHVAFDSCSFQTGSVGMNADIGITSVSVSLADCDYTGASPCVDFSNLSSSQISYITATGGYLGSHAHPIYLGQYDATRKSINIFGTNYGPMERVILTGTLNGGGAAIVAHNIPSANSRVQAINAYYKGGSGEAIPLTVQYVDGINVSVTGGPASGTYRIMLQYVQEAVAW